MELCFHCNQEWKLRYYFAGKKISHLDAADADELEKLEEE
jgi:hypothetical protein